MITKEYNTWKFEELSEEMQEKVLDRYRNFNVDDNFWHDCVLEDWKDALEKMGFDNPEINFSGFWSQGDGASFTCKHIQLDTFITSQRVKGQYKNILKSLTSFGDVEVMASVDRIDHHYSHENTVRAQVDVDGYDSTTKFYDKCYTEGNKLESFITQVVRSTSKKIYRDLDKAYEHLTSDEAVKESLIANEYDFDEHGKIS